MRSTIMSVMEFTDTIKLYQIHQFTNSILYIVLQQICNEQIKYYSSTTKCSAVLTALAAINKTMEQNTCSHNYKL